MVRATYPGAERPLGYVEVQSSWLAEEKNTDQIREHVQELIAKTLREQPHLKHHSSLADYAADGAGRQKVNLYLGFVPKHVAAPPPDPRNLNDAPLPKPGMIEPSDGITPLGWKEGQFGRGT